MLGLVFQAIEIKVNDVLAKDRPDEGIELQPPF
jgi:hypothetical protein